jgi:site-specific DNA-methyltransferase (adenine-specific)
MRLILGKSEEKLCLLADASVDSIVTDPPYELGFMGKGWDSTGIAYNVGMWKQCLRVLKPGGHLLSFGGSRTYHRMASAIEDAGFEVRDQIMWVYGSGFPKSMDVSKAIDKELEVEGSFGGPKSAAHAGWIDRGRMRGEEGHEGYQRPWMQDSDAVAKNARIYIPGSAEAEQWVGWGTALKPAHEPIVLARKPLDGRTVAANVLTHGTGVINIGASRIPGEPIPINILEKWSGFGEEKRPDYTATVNNEGRFPANLIHDGSDEVLLEFAKYGESTSKKGKPRKSVSAGLGWGMTATGAEYDDKGSPARFFYGAKAGKKDRHEGLDDPGHQFKHGSTLRVVENTETKGNNHPTVKPTELMRYLCRLVTPPGGVVLDPFTGSGSTGKAAVLEGFDFIGIEQDETYLEIARKRIEFVNPVQKMDELEAAFA